VYGLLNNENIYVWDELNKWGKRNEDITVKHVGAICPMKGSAGKDTDNMYARTAKEEEKRRMSHRLRHMIGKNITYLKGSETV